jgi:hypothetical protein
MRKTVLRSLLIAAAVSSIAMAQDKPADKPAEQALPVKNVVLFSSGVGYFEHFGPVQGDGSTELRFKTTQINDILKSLVLQDLDGGKVSTVQYPSQDPVEKTLASFQVDISENPSLAQLINQLRGAKVILEMAAEKYEGTILGAELRKVSAKPDAEPVEVWYVNLLNGSSIRQIELARVTDLKIQDPKLQDELARALAALAKARDQDKKSVVINFAGKGERRIRLGYVVEAPVWKTSYRLVMGDEANTLQGWAIVENQTDNDWDNVQLNLVSGRPISFVMNLYQPLYVPRPTVEMELYQSLRPQTYDDGMADAKVANQRRAADAAEKGGRDRGAPPQAAAPSGGFGALADEQLRVRKESMDELAKAIDPTASIQSVASAAKLGELFQYSVGNVSLPRQKSAMIPIVSDKVEVEKVSIYNQRVLQKHPLNGAHVTNNTGKHLLQGPITVFEAGSYAGDAQIDNVPPGQKRLLSYGIDLQTLVQTAPKSDNSVVTGKLVKGVLQVTQKRVASMTYAIENKGDTDKTLVVEHPINSGWKLVGSPDPMETTQTLYRFKVPTPKGEKKELKVNEENVYVQAIAILPADIGVLTAYVRTGEIPEKVRNAISEAIKRKQDMVAIERQVNDRQQQISAITQEQGRIRENMKTVDRTSQYYNRLLTKLNQQETQLESLNVEVDDLRTKLQAAQKSLEDYVNAMNVE